MTFGVSLRVLLLSSCVLATVISVRNSAAQPHQQTASGGNAVLASDTHRMTLDRGKIKSLAHVSSVNWSKGDSGWTTTIIPERTVVLGCAGTTVDSILHDSPAAYMFDYKPIIRFNCSKLMVVEPLLACQWLMQEKPVAGATNATYQPTEAGSYTVTVVDKMGRIGTSEPTVVKDEADVTLLSDPDNNRLIINRIDVTKLVLWNEQGAEVLQVANTPKLNLEQLPEGRYDVAVWLGGCFARRFKVVKASK